MCSVKSLWLSGWMVIYKRFVLVTCSSPTFLKKTNLIFTFKLIIIFSYLSSSSSAGVVGSVPGQGADPT